MKITDKDLTAMRSEDLLDLAQRIKVVLKTQRQEANASAAALYDVGDTIEFVHPKSNETKTAKVVKVKRAMLAIKAGSVSMNIPYSLVVKKTASAPTTEKATAKKTTSKNEVIAKTPTKAAKKEAPQSNKSVINALREKAQKAAAAKKVVAPVTPVPDEAPPAVVVIEPNMEALVAPPTSSVTELATAE